MTSDPTSRNLNCLRCDMPLAALGTLPLRAGGSTGGWAFWMGDLAELGERIVHLDAFRCPSCGHLEFFDFNGSLPQS